MAQFRSAYEFGRKIFTGHTTAEDVAGKAKEASQKRAYAQSVAQTAIGPRSTAITSSAAGLATGKQKKRKQFALMTGGLGELDLNKPKLLGR